MIRSQNNLDEETIRFTEKEQRIWVSADEMELKTVFSNLLENAVKYSKDIGRYICKVSRTLKRFCGDPNNR